MSGAGAIGPPELADQAGSRSRRPDLSRLVRQLAPGRLLRDRSLPAGFGLVTLFAALAVIGPIAYPLDPQAVDVAHRFLPPSWAHPLGTDDLGRDELARLLHGARLSIATAVLTTLGIALIGLAVGAVAGFFGGYVDALLSWVIDTLLAFPTFLLALAVTGVLGPSLRNVVLGLAVVWWAGYARIVRGALLAERERQYVEAARAGGATTLRLLVRHLLPNIVGPVVVLTTLDMGAVLLGVSGFSFLGLGVRPPTPEWGAMLADGRRYVTAAPAMMLYPGAAIFLMVLGLNLLGDGLRDRLDPRLARGRAQRG